MSEVKLSAAEQEELDKVHAEQARQAEKAQTGGNQWNDETNRSATRAQADRISGKRPPAQDAVAEAISTRLSEMEAAKRAAGVEWNAKLSVQAAKEIAEELAAKS